MLHFVYCSTLTDEEQVGCTVAVVVCRKQKIKMDFLAFTSVKFLKYSI